MSHAARFYVNNMGEFGHIDPDGETLDYGGTVNTAGKSRKQIEHEFAIQRVESCQNVAELELMEEHDRLTLDNGRWRVNAHIDYRDFTRDMVLNTEFIWRTDDRDWWTELERIATEQGFELEEMWEHSPESGYWEDADSLPANFNDMTDAERKALPQYVPSPEEGVVKTQVSVGIDIHGKTAEERDAIIERFEKATEKLWTEAGVNVL